MAVGMPTLRWSKGPLLGIVPTDNGSTDRTLRYPNGGRRTLTLLKSGASTATGFRLSTSLRTSNTFATVRDRHVDNVKPSLITNSPSVPLIVEGWCGHHLQRGHHGRRLRLHGQDLHHGRQDGLTPAFLYAVPTTSLTTVVCDWWLPATSLRLARATSPRLTAAGTCLGDDQLQRHPEHRRQHALVL